MHFKKPFPGTIWLNKALLPESADYSVYSNVMNINIDFLKFISNLFATPEVVILFHFKNQFLNFFDDRISTRCFIFITPEALNKSALPVKQSFRFN
jgi:hypothetical protein